PRHTLLPISETGSDSDFLQHAQRRWSQIVHHSEWLKLLWRLSAVSRREMVRFVSVSQPGAGRFLDAVPARAAFRMPTWCMSIAVQRRLGLPLLAAAAVACERFSRHGKVFDAYGDVAINDGEAGHATRHYLVLRALFEALRRAWGGMVRYEPTEYKDYSDHRPDLTLQTADGLVALDLKVFDPVGSDAGEVEGRGAFVAFGNTRPRARAIVRGLAERGVPGTAFDPSTGKGHVAFQAGDYGRAAARGMRVMELLVETFGGLGDGLMELLEEAAGARGTSCRRLNTTRRPGRLGGGWSSCSSASPW
ncbi:MAG: hypothetical protein VYD05_09750, partial [Planctomycetota bacterium]|nr:hypothetical protein [Planctomycetota bacterium]